MIHVKKFSQFLESIDKNLLYKKGDILTIDMGDGPEEVTVLSKIKAGVSGIDFITLSRKKGVPYTITLNKLAKVLIN